MSNSEHSLATVYATIGAEVERLLADGLPHPFSRSLFKRFGISEAEFVQFILSARASFPEISQDGSTHADRALVPKLAHRVWITDPATPHAPPIHYLSDIAECSKENEDWQFFLWTNVTEAAVSLNSFFQNLGAAIHVRVLSEIFSDDALFSAANDFVADRKFVGASDVVRFMILKRFGGIYSDLGVKYTREILNLSAHSGAVINLDSQLMFQLAFLGFPPQDPFIKLWANICVDPHKFTAPLYPIGQSFRAIEELSFLSGPGFTAMVMLFLEANRRILIVPQQGRYLKISSQKSWYGEQGKFGNVVVSQTDTTRLKTAIHDCQRSALEKQSPEIKAGATSSIKSVLLQSLTQDQVR